MENKELSYELLNQKIDSLEKLLLDKISNLETNKIEPLQDDCKIVKGEIDILKQQNTKTDVQYTNIMETLKKLASQVEELKDKPAKRWDTVISSILGAICGVIGGVIAGLFFKNQT